MTLARNIAMSAGGLLGCALLVAWTPAQPERRQVRQAQPETPRERAGDQISPERIRKRLDDELRRIERDRENLARREKRVRDAMARIDAGERPGAVMREMEEGDGEGMRPGGRLEGPPPGGEVRRAPLSPEDRERLVRFLEAEMPDLARRMRGMADQAPGEADRMYGRLAPRVMELMELRHEDPEMAEIRVREFRASLAMVSASRELREAVRTTEEGSAERQRARRTLRAALAETFDAKNDARALEIRRLGERIAELEEELDEQRRNRDRLLDEEVERMESDAAIERRRGR